jgi:hypothetical protein
VFIIILILPEFVVLCTISFAHASVGFSHRLDDDGIRVPGSQLRHGARRILRGAGLHVNLYVLASVPAEHWVGVQAARSSTIVPVFFDLQRGVFVAVAVRYWL